MQVEVPSQKSESTNNQYAFIHIKLLNVHV